MTSLLTLHEGAMMPKKPLRISKSQYLKGIQCPNALWLYRHRPDLYPEISESQQHIFDTGHEIGLYAQRYFDNGIEITEKYYEIDQDFTVPTDSLSVLPPCPG
jgi:hypothetical protein